ncbi:hypothetical protein RUND412_006877 [Rhizina undulata]
MLRIAAEAHEELCLRAQVKVKVIHRKIQHSHQNGRYAELLVEEIESGGERFGPPCIHANPENERNLERFLVIFLDVESRMMVDTLYRAG